MMVYVQIQFLYDGLCADTVCVWLFMCRYGSCMLVYVQIHFCMVVYEQIRFLYEGLCAATVLV
jgi:hypothetical protein